MDIKYENNLFTDVTITPEYAKYTHIEDIVGGKRIIIKHPFNGDLEIDYYKIHPEIKIVETHTKKASIDSNYKSIFTFHNPNLIALNCIIKGRCQVPVGRDKYVFLKDGDMNIYKIQDYPETFNYGADTHILFIILTKNFLQQQKNQDIININQTINNLFRIVDRHSNLIYHDNKQIKEILEQIVNFQPSISKTKNTYQLIKFLELMIHVYNFDIPENNNLKQLTYTDSQIRVVRKIKKMIERDISSYDSLKGLSIQYGINTTTLKTCFKEMYGKPLYTWYRSYKFKRAKELIKNTDFTITKIARMIGYKNSSKFSKAFKEEFGVLPSVYRKKKTQKK